MMKFYANLFELTADSISVKSIRRLRWLTIGSLPLLPMLAFLVIHGLPNGYTAIPFMIAFVLLLILTTTVLFARIVNRVWSPDKYLDEWEKDLKRKSMTMAFMVVMYVVLGMTIALAGLYDFIAPYVDENPKTIPILILIFIVGAGLYTQIFTQLSLIEPMDEDELDKPQYIVTSARSIMGIIAIAVVGLMTLVIAFGYYSGHRSHVVLDTAAQQACGEAELKNHKKVDNVYEITCKGLEGIIFLDPETLKPIEP